MLKKALKKSVWEKEEYFISARRATLVVSDNFELKRLKEYSKGAAKILDCGCGEGTVIELIWYPKADFWGVDLSQQGIAMGKKRLKDKKNIHLRIWDLEKLNFLNEEFDLVYMVNTLEHLDNPQKVIKEMIRVTKKDGHLVFISPNYGSPIYPSPSSPPRGETLITRAIKIFLKSHFYFFKKPQGLDWMKVFPVVLREKRWEPDWDTVVEPYLQSLLIFLKDCQVEVVERYSVPQNTGGKMEWRLTNKQNLRQKILTVFKKMALSLGKMGISPYNYFGPILFVVGKKK